MLIPGFDATRFPPEFSISRRFGTHFETEEKVDKSDFLSIQNRSTKFVKVEIQSLD
ncbi:5727_t:CDS:2, partial [Acaulospora morrowiae]